MCEFFSLKFISQGAAICVMPDVFTHNTHTIRYTISWSEVSASSAHILATVQVK